MARRKHSRRHKNHNSRNHFSSTRPESSEGEILLEFDLPRNASNFISSLEDTILVLDNPCLGTPKKVLKIGDGVDVPPLQSDFPKYRSNSCIPKFGSSSRKNRKYVVPPQTDDIVDTPKCSYKYSVKRSVKDEFIINANYVNENDTESSQSTETDNVINVSDLCVKKFAASTPSQTPKVSHSCTQTDFGDSFENIQSKRHTCKNMPKYKVRIKNCDVSLKNVYCNQIRAPTEIRAFKNCIQVIAAIQEFHANYTYHIAKHILKVCWWFGVAFKSSVSAVYGFYKDHRVCSTLQYEIHTLNETIKALVIDNALLRSEFHDIKQELKTLKEGSVVRQPCIQAPPPPPPPPPPPLPPLALSNNSQKTNTLKTFRKKLHEQNSRPIISLDDILKVKLRKTAERPSTLRRSIDPLISTSLKHVKLRPTPAKVLTCSSMETPSTGSSLSNSPQSSLTRLLLTVDTKVRRVKRLHRQSAYSFDDFSRSSPQSRRDRQTIGPVA